MIQNEGEPTCDDYTEKYDPELGDRNFYGTFTPPSNIAFSETGITRFILVMTITDPEFDINNQTYTMQMTAYDLGECFHR